MAHFKSASHTLKAMAGVLFMLTGCASTGVVHQQGEKNKSDPYEHINRKIYTFNDHVDNYIAEPIANVYRKITPQFMQTGVFNFYNNLKNVNVVFNDVLQGKFEQSAKDTGRLAINSSLGLLGIVDVAKRVGLEQNDEDFDQTLAVWGLPTGPYLVLPFLGPITARGIPGAVFDTAANPSSYVGAPVQLLSLLNTRANAEGSLKFIDEAALDPYLFTRESFLQWRYSLATDGLSLKNVDFEDELDDDALDNKAKQSNDKFSEASKSFSTTAQTLERAAEIFKETSTKLDQIKH